MNVLAAESLPHCFEDLHQRLSRQVAYALDWSSSAPSGVYFFMRPPSQISLVVLPLRS